MKAAIFSIVLVLAAGLAVAHSSSYRSQFATGYERGYTHGQADYRNRMSFDYSNPTESQSDDWSDCQYRLGYLQGYSDGYFSIPKKTDLDEAAPGDRDHDRDHQDQQVGVTVYTDGNFHGKSAQFQVGDYPRFESSFNDTIESIQIRGNVRIILFDQSEFRGETKVIEQTSSDLGSFKNKAASMIIERLPQHN